MVTLASRIRGAALAALRHLKGWTGLQLAQAVGTSKGMISHYESGHKELSLERFLEYGLAMGYTLRRLEAARFGLGVSAWELESAPAAAITAGSVVRSATENDPERRWAEEALRRRLAAEMAGLVGSRTTDRALQRTEARWRARRDRRAAEELCRRLLRLHKARQAIWVAEDPAFQAWAVIERLGEMSATAASSNPARARQLAGWAKRAAEASPETPDKPRRVGYAGFFFGNALRVLGNLDAADAGFAAAWEQWQVGDVPGAPPFARWRPFDLETSLRIDQQRWAVAAELSGHALSLAPPGARARILLNKASCLQFGGAPARAIPILAEAAPLIDAGREPRLAFAAHFTFAACLHDIGRFAEAERHLGSASALAAGLESAPDLARCDWLGGKLAVVRGEREKGLAAFAHAQEVFAAHGMALDCAAVALHESIVLLEAGDTKRAKRCAATVAWTFGHHGIAREGREALEVFCRAAAREEATADLARWAFAQLNPRGPAPGEPVAST